MVGKYNEVELSISVKFMYIVFI